MLYKMTELKYQPDQRLERALDILFILHADHEQNCSTSAVRSVGSSQVDPYSAVAAGVAALYGPLHGGANEAVLRMLHRIESKDNVPDFIKGVKEGKERLMGFGHRVYKNYDPRAKIIKTAVDDVFEVTGTNPLLEIALELEKIALEDEYFIERKLYPNVDFYSGLIYEALGMPVSMFPVLFAIPRTSGWIAQWLEMVQDSEQKIARPRQLYTGARDRDYVPIAHGPDRRFQRLALRRHGWRTRIEQPHRGQASAARSAGDRRPHSRGAVARRVARSACSATIGILAGVDASAPPGSSDADGRLRCRATWQRPGAELDEFEAETRERSLARWEGLPGRTWALGEPMWIPDAADENVLPVRPRHGARRRAWGWPAPSPSRSTVGERFDGVLEFFSRLHPRARRRPAGHVRRGWLAPRAGARALGRDRRAGRQRGAQPLGRRRRWPRECWCSAAEWPRRGGQRRCCADPRRRARGARRPLPGRARRTPASRCSTRTAYACPRTPTPSSTRCRPATRSAT